MDEGEIFWAARFLVVRWGDHAGAYAARKANELFARGDANGCDLWRCIREFVNELQGDRSARPTIH